MNMTIEDIKEYKRNAIEILGKNSQYATAKVTEEAFDTFIWFTEVLDKFNSIPYTSSFLTPDQLSDLPKSTT